mgnify:CR=1 FL=1
MMEKAGFEDVTWKNYTGGIAAVHVAKSRRRRRGIAAGSHIRIPPRKQDLQTNVLLDKMNSYTSQCKRCA